MGCNFKTKLTLKNFLQLQIRAFFLTCIRFALMLWPWFSIILKSATPCSNRGLMLHCSLHCAFRLKQSFWAFICIFRRCCKSEWPVGSFSSFWGQEPEVTLAVWSWHSICGHRPTHGFPCPCKWRLVEGSIYITCRSLWRLGLKTHHCNRFRWNWALRSNGYDSVVIVYIVNVWDILRASIIPLIPFCEIAFSIQVMSNQEAIDLARREKDPLKGAKALVTEAVNRDSKDDISCIVVRLKAWFTRRNTSMPLFLERLGSSTDKVGDRGIIWIRVSVHRNIWRIYSEKKNKKR